MSSNGAGYDQSVTTFGPNGKVYQVDYAMKAVEKSGLTVGVRCVDGVVLGVEKLILSKMMVQKSNRRIFTADLHSGVATAGIAADARQLVNKARDESRSYKGFYGAEIPGKILAGRLAGHVHMHTLYWYLRPFGSSILVSNYDDTMGPQLYMIDPSGTSHRYFASAIGNHRLAAQSELEKMDFDKITCREAVMKIAEMIYKLHDDIKDKAFELEMTWVCDESGRKHRTIPEDLRQEAVKAAVEAKEKSEMDDSDDDDDDEE